MIRYKKYQNQTKSTPLSGKWLARAVADETLDTRALAEHMAKHNTPYSQGAIHGGPQGHDLLHQRVAARRQEREAGRPRHLRRGDPRETCRHVERLVGHYQRGRLRLKCRATGTLAINQLKLEAQLKELSPYDIEGGNTGGGGEEERPGEL